VFATRKTISKISGIDEVSLYHHIQKLIDENILQDCGPMLKSPGYSGKLPNVYKLRSLPKTASRAVRQAMV
jgi:hypothetical protein